MDTEALVNDFLTAWNALESGPREAALERCWAEDGTYVDPTIEVRGRAAFAEHLAGFQQRFPGTHFERGGLDGHGRHLRFGWRLVHEDGSEKLRGTDIGRVDDHGRLVSIVGFFGDLAG